MFFAAKFFLLGVPYNIPSSLKLGKRKTRRKVADRILCKVF